MEHAPGMFKASLSLLPKAHTVYWQNKHNNKNKNTFNTVSCVLFLFFFFLSPLKIQFKALQAIKKSFSSTTVTRHQTCNEVNLEQFIRHLRQCLANSLPIRNSITNSYYKTILFFSVEMIWQQCKSLHSFLVRKDTMCFLLHL